MKPDRLALLHDVADAVAKALLGVTDWGPSGSREGQYAVDLVVDAAALKVLRSAHVGVLSEESGTEHDEYDEIVVVDPLDGSTNASRGLPWYATSLCLVDGDGPAVALVANQASGVRYWAVRGEGAWCNGRRLVPSNCEVLSDAIVGISSAPPSNPGWAQFRALGACALDLCLVADGVLDGFVDCGVEQHGVWDFLAGVLICNEAGATVSDAADRDLCVLDHRARRTPVAGATRALHDSLRGVRRRLP
ncbi:MAG: inositol monophosphatase [Ilumatobacteraceae bacterium]